MNADQQAGTAAIEVGMTHGEAALFGVSKKQRLAAVQQLRLMDTEPEQEFDELVELAAELCEVPISLMTLLDDRRQFLKARVGIDRTEMPISESICQYTIRQDGCFTVSDASQDERFAALPVVADDPGVRFYAGIPLRTATGLAVGALCVLDTKPRALTERQERILKILGNQISARIQMRAHAREIEKMAHKVIAERELFRSFLDSMPLEVYLKDAQGKILFYNRKLAERFAVSQTAWLGKTSYDLWPKEKADLIRAEEEYALKLNRPHESYVELADRKGAATYWKTIMTPVRRETGEALLTNVAIDLSPELHRQAALQEAQDALEEANRKLRSLSLTDTLTGLWNRRAFDARVETELSRAQCSCQPLTLLMMDVDDFKEFNDVYGHSHGDDVLRQVAGILRHAARVDDVVVRYGGEEFAILLPNTDLQGAKVLCNRINSALSRAPWMHRAVTVSIGIALSAWRGTPTELLNMADSAMYRAKHNGKNCVVSCGAGGETAREERLQLHGARWHPGSRHVVANTGPDVSV